MFIFDLGNSKTISPRGLLVALLELLIIFHNLPQQMEFGHDLRHDLLFV